MKTVILLGGLHRGTKESWGCIKQLSEYLNAKVYVCSDKPWGEFEDWPPPFNGKGVEMPNAKVVHPFLHKWVKHKKIKNDLFDKMLTRDDDSCSPERRDWLRQQWSPLYRAYKEFKNEFNKDDIIIKLRNDLVFHSPMKIISDLDVKPNTVYTPKVEFHTEKAFNLELTSNDQFWIMKKPTADKVFELPYKMKQPFGIAFKTKKRMPLKIMDEIGYGVPEIIFRNYLYQENIKLKTFGFTYTVDPIRDDLKDITKNKIKNKIK
jgi:hypothetical protein